jgi:hypothetical protein
VRPRACCLGVFQFERGVQEACSAPSLLVCACRTHRTLFNTCTPTHVTHLHATRHRNKECLSLGCDEVPLFWGRSPVVMYRDFMDAFANAFQHLFGTVITGGCA